jgi:hypothetical protein
MGADVAAARLAQVRREQDRRAAVVRYREEVAELNRLRAVMASAQQQREVAQQARVKVRRASDRSLRRALATLDAGLGALPASGEPSSIEQRERRAAAWSWRAMVIDELDARGLSAVAE